MMLIIVTSSAELENHLGISEKTLAEFIVELSKDKTSSKQFGQVSFICCVWCKFLKKLATIFVRDCITLSNCLLLQALVDNGAEMPTSLVETLWNIIQRLKVSYF